MKKRISLDCDGVIANNGAFFKNYFLDFFGVPATAEIIKSIIEGKEIIPKEELKNFLENYNLELFKSIGELEPIPEVQSNIEKLKSEGIIITANSYRPNQYKNLEQDTEKITQDWFRRHRINIPVNTFENRQLKLEHICSGEYEIHVDDDVGILKKIEKNITPILFNIIYSSNDKFTQFNSWNNLRKHIVGYEFVR